MDTVRVLIVDDELKMRSLLRRVLETEGFATMEAASANAAEDRFARGGFDLVLLDVNLRDGDGLSLARKFRERSQAPIIFVTGKDDIIDRVVGLELGGDDYITKPFHVRELVARIRSVLRRSSLRVPGADAEALYQPGKLQVDGLEIRLDSMEVIGRNGTPIELTGGEFRLLSVFLASPQRVLSRDRLMNAVGGTGWSPLDRAIDNRVSRLRKKIERDPANPALIRTMRGSGYVFAAECTETGPALQVAKIA